MAHGDANYQQSRQAQGPPPLTNFAPITPLLDLKDNDKGWKDSSINQIFREFHLDIRNRYVEVRREIAEVGRLMANLRSGKLIMQRDPIYGSLALLKPLPNKPRNDRHVYPLAQVKSSELTASWTMSRPRIVPRHFGNSNEAQIQTALIEQMVGHYQSELFDEIFHQEQSLSMMDYGTTAIRVFPDDQLNTLRELQPIFQNTEKTVFPGHAFCHNCLRDGQPDEFQGPSPEYPQCPDCGTYINPQNMVPPQTGTVAEVVGTNEIKQGDIGAELLHIPGLNWDMRKLVHLSSYVAYRSEVSQNLVRSMLGIDVTEANPDDDYGLRVMNALGTRGGSTQGWGRDALWGHQTWFKGAALMDEEYYTPEWYAGMKLSADEKTVSGETIPKGVPFEQLWPDGVCVTGFNDMQIIVSIHNEKRRITGGVYHIQSHSGYGKGTADAIEISEQLNIAHSANLAVLKRYGAGGGYWYDKAVMSKTEAKALLKPDGLVGIQMRGTQYRNVGEAIQQLVHKPQNQESLALVASLGNLLNIVFQSTDFTEGAASDKVNIDTLGGQQMLAAKNQERSMAPLRMKGYTFALVFEDIIDIARDYFKIAKFFPSRDKFALSQGRFISGADIPAKVKMDFVVDSEIPTNSHMQKENAAQMLKESVNFGIPFPQLAKEQPRMAAWWVGMFPGVDMPLFNQTELLIVCQNWMDKIKAATAEEMQSSQVSGFYPDPEQTAQKIVASLMLPKDAQNQAIKADLIKEYLDTDEIQTWPPVQMAAVELLIQTLYENDSGNRMRVPAIDAAAQAQMAAQAQQMLAQGPPPVQPPHWSEVANYADLPPDVQRQVEQQLGFQPSRVGGSSIGEKLATDAQNVAQDNEGTEQPDTNAELHKEGVTRTMDEAQKNNDFVREEAAKQNDHKRNIELEKLKQHGKPRPTGGPARRK